jgi:DNA-binding CsgD family transcriptional regulator
MNALNELIRCLYAVTADADWRSAREQALELVRLHFGATAAATTTFSEGGAGTFTESLRSGFNKTGLSAVHFPVGHSVQALKLTGAMALAASYGHANGGLSSILALRWPASSKPPADEAVLTALTHLAEATALAQRLFIQRDEWLMSLGRSNRGAAALVDGRGFVHAATERFRSFLGTQGGAPDRLPFELPELGIEDKTSALQGTLHVRVERMDGLLLVHLRQPLPLDVLSPREQQIARALGAGKTFKSVAKQCDIAVSTVANHATRIYRKLGVFRREELVELIRSPGLHPRNGKKSS